MPKTYSIGDTEIEEIRKARKNNRDKQVEKRLHAVHLRWEGKNNAEIAKQLDMSSDVVSRWVAWYATKGLEALLPKKREAHRRNISFAEEKAFLNTYEERALAGQIVEVSEIKKAYEEKVGHKIGGGQIYRVLKRHEWRKIKPRSRHPKKADEEAIAASKKLTSRQKRRFVR